MRRFAAASTLVLLLGQSAEARMHHPYRAHRMVPLASAPLDTFATPAAAYSMRRLKSSYAGPAVRLRRASDNAEQDIGFLGFTGFTGAPVDVAAAVSFCSATTCFKAKWYDQSGNGRDDSSGAVNQQAIVFNCLAGLPCLEATGTQISGTASITPSLPVTFSVVANRASGIGGCYFNRQSGAENVMMGWDATANQWISSGGGASWITVFAPDAQWHAAQTLINGAASLVRIDATETAGTLTGSVAAGAYYLSTGIAGTACRSTENIHWNGYALSPAERAALQNNQKSFWGTQ